jgi:hypothetical protein
MNAKPQAAGEIAGMVFQNRDGTSFTQITDVMSNTLMLTEAMDRKSGWSSRDPAA